jgi:hypothetical protein
MMIAEFVKRIHHKYTFQDVWFWRDSAGHEVDFLIQDGQKLNIVEMKAGQTVMPDMFNGLTWWEQVSGKQNLSKTLVYGGNEMQTRNAGEVLPWKEFGK